MTVSAERFQKAKIIFRKDHTEDLWSIRVRPEHPLAFKPGQYATLGIEEEGKVVERDRTPSARARMRRRWSFSLNW